MKTQHTPTPWALADSDYARAQYEGRVFIGMPRTENTDHDLPLANRICEIYGDISLPITEANAEFIVRAVNSHDALVAACQKMRDVLEDPEIDYNDQSVIEDLHDTIRNALKIAKGEL